MNCSLYRSCLPLRACNGAIPEKASWPWMARKLGIVHFLPRNLSLSLFSLGRVQEMNLGFMRALAGEFDVNHASHD